MTVGILEHNGSNPVNIGGAIPDLILLNNDLTEGPLPDLGVPILPSPKMGWYQRRKSAHFRAIQPLIDEISELLEIDPWLLSTQWFVSEEKCLDKDTCRILLAAEADEFLAGLQRKYDQYGISGTPTIFVKNDSGTFGLGIIEITSGEELLELSNRKLRSSHMAKGERKQRISCCKKGFQVHFHGTEWSSNQLPIVRMGVSVAGFIEQMPRKEKCPISTVLLQYLSIHMRLMMSPSNQDAIIGTCSSRRSPCLASRLNRPHSNSSPVISGGSSIPMIS